MAARYRSYADTMLLYVSEAHAVDEWPIGQPAPFCRRQPRTLQERCDGARALVSEFAPAVRVYVDGMDNAFQLAFSAWPLRFVIVLDERVHYLAQPEGDMYALHAVETALRAAILDSVQCDAATLSLMSSSENIDGEIAACNADM